MTRPTDNMKRPRPYRSAPGRICNAFPAALTKHARVDPVRHQDQGAGRMAVPGVACAHSTRPARNHEVQLRAISWQHPGARGYYPPPPNGSSWEGVHTGNSRPERALVTRFTWGVAPC